MTQRPNPDTEQLPHLLLALMLPGQAAHTQLAACAVSSNAGDACCCAAGS